MSVQSNTLTITVTSSNANAPYLPSLYTKVSGYSVVVSWNNFAAVTQSNSSNSGAYITGETVNWGDGSGLLSVPGGDTGAAYSYSSPGTYTITVTVGNSLGISASASTQVTVIKPLVLPSWSWTLSAGNTQNPSNYGISPSNVQGFEPFPVASGLTGYSPGGMGFMMYNISSIGSYLSYELLYGFNINGSYYTMGLASEWWTPVNMLDLGDVNTALSHNASVLSTLPNGWTVNPYNDPNILSAAGQKAAQGAINSFAGLITSLNNWIVVQAKLAEPLNGLGILNPL